MPARKTKGELGGGRKCPRCGMAVDADSAACPRCHKLFDDAEEPSVTSRAKDKPDRRAEKKAPTTPETTFRINRLRIPDGFNPVPLKGRDKATLLKWAEAVRAYWLAKGYFLLKEGLCYYLQWEPQFEHSPRPYEAACQVIETELTDDHPEPKQS